MLELITGLPDGVVGVSATGEVTRHDYENVLVPAVESVLATHDRVRILYVLGTGFTGFSGGAVWQDGKVGAEHWSRWERCALVSDEAWLRQSVQFLGHLMPGEVRSFMLDDRDSAEAWVSA